MSRVVDSKIALGTVQFGLSYGVANNSGQISLNESKDIIHLARQFGVNKLDTAIAYGNSEDLLGKIGVDSWNIVTKLPDIPSEIKDLKRWVADQIQGSLNRLKVSSLYAVMLHTTLPLSSRWAKEYWDILQNLKSQGIIKKIGYSIYDPSELDNHYSKFHPDIIQAPYNVIDNRLKTSGWLQKLSDNLVEIHARSIFLQGLLLMRQDQRPPYFKEWDDLWHNWHNWLESENLSALEATLWFVLQEAMIDNIVVGVDSVNQLQNILDVSNNYNKTIEVDFSNLDERLIDPSKWDTL